MSEESPLAKQDSKLSPPKKGKFTFTKTGIAVSVALLIAGASFGLNVVIYNESMNSMNRVANIITKETDEKIAKINPSLTQEQIGEIVSLAAQQVTEGLDVVAKNTIVDHFDSVKPQMVTAVVEAVQKDMPKVAPVQAKISEREITEAAERVWKKNTRQLQLTLNQKQGSYAQLEMDARALLTEMETQQQDWQQKVTNFSEKQEPAEAPRQRLKSFNLVDIVRDGTYFVVEAPEKNGKPNPITLVIGETFVSKNGTGRHKVESVMHADDPEKRVLFISGGYFIDNVREPYTEADIQAWKQRQAKKAPKQANKPAKKPINSEAEQARHIETNPPKMFLNSWRVVTPIKEQNRVIALNEDSGSLEKFEMGKHYPTLGTVRALNLTTGEVCFEKYCIAGR